MFFLDLHHYQTLRSNQLYEDELSDKFIMDILRLKFTERDKLSSQKPVVGKSSSFRVTLLCTSKRTNGLSF